MDGDYCWSVANSDSKSHPVGEKTANTWGLFDMSGNASEWCQDFYSESAYSNIGSYSNNPSGNPVYEISGSDRTIRGGNYDGCASACTSARRYGMVQYGANGGIGFRIARTYSIN